MSNRGDTVLDCVYGWEAESPSRLYMTQPLGAGAVREFTWHQAMNEVRRMAAYLRSLDFPPGSSIALMSSNCAYWVMADLAIWMAGHVTVPLYPTLLVETVDYILSHCEAKLLFLGKLENWDSLQNGIAHDLPCISFPLSPENPFDTWDDIIQRTEPLSDNARRNANELATIIYTSGSTGKPKGVMLSFGALSDVARGFKEIIDIHSEDRMISYLPLAHAYERCLVEICSFMWGIQLFFVESINTFLVDLKRARPTLFISVPRLWLKFQQGVFAKIPEQRLNLLLKIPLVATFIRRKILTGLGLGCVRYAGSGSAPIPAALISWYRNLGLELLEGYAMTENFAYSHVTFPGKSRPGYVGHPALGVEARISEEGEVLVKSPGNMMGYYKLPELTAETLTEDGFIKTGDLGELDEMGRLRITGRKKELFKTSKGKYIAPTPIENSLLTHNMLEQACVSGTGSPQPFAIVVLGDEIRAALSAHQRKQDEITAELSAHLEEVNRHLDHHEHLQFMVIAKNPWTIENGLLTPTMKLKRAAIEEQYRPEVENWFKMNMSIIWE